MRRTKWIRNVFLILLLLLCGRLYYVQILCADELTAAAHGQQMIPVVQENGKGTIYDRNMTPLTGTDRVYYYLIHKDNLTAGAERQLTRMEAEPAGKKGEEYLVYRAGRYVPSAGFVLQKQYKAYGFCVDVRYGEKQTAAALVTDLDEMYDGLLQKEEPTFYFLGNGAGDLMRGTGMTKERTSGDVAGIITTIDLPLQKEIEGMFEDIDATGCAVVTDVVTGQILAMVSRGGEQAPNLAVEKAYPMGAAYGLVRKTAAILDVTPPDVARALELGTPVFDNYPGETAGEVLKQQQTTATVAQVSQMLVTLANQGDAVPLSLIMSTVQEERVPCIASAEETGAALEKLQGELTQKPLTGDGWSAGYVGADVIAIHLEEGNPKKIYHLVADCLLAGN